MVVAPSSIEMNVFVAAVDAGGFSAAARLLDLTPSAVSKQISRLETRLGARLLNRSTRRISLTAAGREFYDRSRAILADIDEARLQRNLEAIEDPELRNALADLGRAVRVGQESR